jgi:hypothetical protein
MRKLKTICGLIIGSIYFSSCTTMIAITPIYDIALVKVEKSIEVKERYGKNEKITFNEFEDGLMKIRFVCYSSGISFSLSNKTKDTIKIIWDDCAYIDEKSGSHKVIHSGVKLISRNEPQAPSVIASNTSIEETIYPSDYIEWGYREWTTNPLLPQTEHFGGSIYDNSKEIEKSVNTFKENVNKLKGKNISVLLVLKVKDVSNEYRFVFEIKDVIISQRSSGDTILN